MRCILLMPDDDNFARYCAKSATRVLTLTTKERVTVLAFDGHSTFVTCATYMQCDTLRCVVTLAVLDMWLTGLLDCGPPVVEAGCL
jgi:hypothetical protein